MTPRLEVFKRDGMHRLIPSRWSDAGTVLADVADSGAMLEDVILLDGATNDRIQGEMHGLGGISTYELIYGVPNTHIINATFTHASDEGGRFNDGTRGAWYAAEALDVSVAEVTYHRARRLAEMIVPGGRWHRPDGDTATYDDWTADFHAAFHVLRPAEEYAEYLRPEPVPACYAASQQLARSLLADKSNGVLYESVRLEGRCVACFRPALVYNPRRGERLEITFIASEEGYEHTVRNVSLK